MLTRLACWWFGHYDYLCREECCAGYTWWCERCGAMIQDDSPVSPLPPPSDVPMVMARKGIG